LEIKDAIKNDLCDEKGKNCRSRRRIGVTKKAEMAEGLEMR